MVTESQIATRKGVHRRHMGSGLGLPLHLWSHEIFMKIGDLCSGLVKVDHRIARLESADAMRLNVVGGAIQSIPRVVQLNLQGHLWPLQIEVEHMNKNREDLINDVFDSERNNQEEKDDVRFDDNALNDLGIFDPNQDANSRVVMGLVTGARRAFQNSKFEVGGPSEPGPNLMDHGLAKNNGADRSGLGPSPQNIWLKKRTK